MPSFLVGWGAGYRVTSTPYLLGLSWHRGWWQSAPFVLTVVGYIVLQLFLVVGISMLADPGVLGVRLGAYNKHGVDILRNRRSVVYWTLATALRDVVVSWVRICLILRYSLYYTNDDDP